MQRMAQCINTLADFCGKRDVDALTPQALQVKYGFDKADVMVLFGGSILEGGHVLAQAIKDGAAKYYIIVGGEGHTTQTLRDKMHAAYPAVETAGLPEAQVFAQYLEKVHVHAKIHADSEAAAYAIAYQSEKLGSVAAGIAAVMQMMRGAYAMVVVAQGALYAFRDPNGIRPLTAGKLPDGGWAVASETCGLDIVGADELRDVGPGEVIRLDEMGMTVTQGMAPSRRSTCIFEYVYFARPDSVIDGRTVYQARVSMGRMLAHEAPVDADLVLGVPDSGVPGALGFSKVSGIPFADGIVKNRYTHRTFIQPTQALRRQGIRIKLNPLPSVIAGKRLVVVDDSIVRGNTAKELVQMLRDVGAAEVHLRIICPEVKWPCFYGIDTAARGQLLSANMDVEEARAWLGADSLAFLSEAGLIDAVRGYGPAVDATTDRCTHDGFCLACFNGEYPVRS